MIERAAEAKPWPRISATLPLPMHFAKSRPCAMFRTSKSVSPNFLRMSHTGTLPPIKLPEWITGSSGFDTGPNGSGSSARACTTATMSTRDPSRRQRAPHEEALRIVGMTYAYMAIGIDHVFVGKNAIGDDEVAQQI